MPDPASQASQAPAALAAFLRGVERRGALLAQLQCGDAELGDVALATAMRGFRGEAGDGPMADWPRRFWQRLTSAPQLRHSAATARWPAPVAHLAGLAAADRLALLSRLAAGLPEDEAAEVLACDLGDYRAALAAACPVDADGQPDAQAWRALAEAIQQQMRDLPPERLARLARLREHALSPRGVDEEEVAPSRPITAPGGSEAPSQGRWRRWAAGAVVAACVGGIGVSYLKPQWLSLEQPASTAPAGPGLGLAEEPAIEVESLPAAETPAAIVDPADATALHPDLELLMDPDGERFAQEAAFHAWYLAGTPPAVTDDAAKAAAAEAAAQEEGRDTTF